MQQMVKDAVFALVSALPIGWSRAWLRVEMQPDGSGGTMSAYSTTDAEPGVAASVTLSPDILVRWQALRNAMAEHADAWTVSTLTLSSDGKFDLHHEYAALTEEPPMKRHAQWASMALEGLKRR